LRIADRLRRVKTADALHRDISSIWPDPSILLARNAGARGHFQFIPGFDDPLPHSLRGDLAGRMMAIDLRTYLPDDILCKVDRAAMGIGLETRVPFLDPQVIAFSARVPTAMKIRAGQGKWLLRQVLYRHVPRHLIERPKTGFSVPLGHWLRGPLRGWAEDLLTPSALEQDGLLLSSSIRTVWAEHLLGHIDRSAQLWVILMFQAWQASRR
jgi:asparagine synthase (glutamine-hydrolysing)